MIEKDRLTEWRNRLERVEPPIDKDWERMQVLQTASGMIRIDVDTNQYSRLTEDFWVTVRDMMQELSKAENQNLSVKVRPV